MSEVFESAFLKHVQPDLSSKFQIVAAPGTDIWDKPPATHSFNAPRIYRQIKTKSLKSVEVNLTSRWHDQYDQGGLVIIVESEHHVRWIKTGIEFYNGRRWMSTVVKDSWSDWSVTAVEDDSIVLRAEKAADGSLWIYMLDTTGDPVPVREVTWWDAMDDNTTCKVGVYAAKPAPNGESADLVVEFKDLSIKTVA